jgi:hypothetical protein
MAEGDELLVLAEDQRIRDAEIRLRSTHPEHRDFTPLQKLLVEDEAAYLPEGFNEIWGDSVELNGRIDVLRQQTFRRSEDEIIVRIVRTPLVAQVGAVPFRGAFDIEGRRGVRGCNSQAVSSRLEWAVATRRDPSGASLCGDPRCGVGL